MTTASLLIAIASALVGVSGVLLALQADKRAKEANRLAEDALTAAREANGLAGEANQLASDANAVSERALSVSAESVDYQWVFEIDDDGVVTVMNDGASPAADVTVVVEDSDGDEVRGSCDVVSPAGEVHLDGESMVEKHLEKVRNAERKWTGFAGNVHHYRGKVAVSTDFKCRLTWKSPRGKELSTVLDLTLRHRVADEQGTIKRIN